MTHHAKHVLLPVMLVKQHVISVKRLVSDVILLVEHAKTPVGGARSNAKSANKRVEKCWMR